MLADFWLKKCNTLMLMFDPLFAFNVRVRCKSPCHSLHDFSLNEVAWCCVCLWNPLLLTFLGPSFNWRPECSCVSRSLAVSLRLSESKAADTRGPTDLLQRGISGADWMKDRLNCLWVTLKLEYARGGAGGREPQEGLASQLLVVEAFQDCGDIRT